MKLLMSAVILVCAATSVVRCQEAEDTEATKPKESWWTGFKSRVKTILNRWKDDIRLLWDEVLAKADDMRGWTAEVFESFKLKMKQWVESRPEVPDDEKNEIETFISKLKVPTEKPKSIDP